MKPKHYQIVYSLILTSLVVIEIPACLCQNAQYQNCSHPFKFNCGNLTEIHYPFWGGDRPVYCDSPGFKLDCQANTPLLNTSSISYRVLNINNTLQTIRVSRNDLWNTVCPQFIHNTTLNFTLFDFYSPANDQNIDLYYDCTLENQPLPVPPPYLFNCSVNSTNSQSFFLARGVLFPQGVATICNSHIVVRVSQTAAQVLTNPTASEFSLQAAFRGGFTIQWSADNERCSTCSRSGGLCGSNSASFVCHCRDGPHDSTCDGSQKGLSNLHKYIIIGVALGIASLVVASSIVFYNKRQCRLSDLGQKSGQGVDKFLLNYGSLAPKRYTYNEIRKITKSFTDKLGQGGYGIVYKGQLPDGQLVAVKVLTEISDDAEEFVNEVASISRTSHVNIVNLLGFCYDRKKRALIYEFMPNKSLDKFIYRSGSVDPECQLEWEKLYQIAVGVARGLEYLHRGCNTRIVHFDIKPQNILLDEDFCPKISDFGLAKLFEKKQSKISMLGTRGTIGFIAPEVFSRNFGVVSHKSDVYSYGMMLLAMAEARKLVEIEGNQSSEVYFFDKIYEHITLENRRLGNLMNEEKEEIVRKMLLVGLWCIQTAPSDRPSMTMVVEMLEGSLQSIQIPPKPFLSSPKLSVIQFSSSVSVTLGAENPSEG